VNYEVDVVVLGVGTGGEDLALQLTGAGLVVVGIEAALLGGECPYWACIPSKIMIRAANLLQEARRVEGIAGRAEVTPDWAPVAARIREEATGEWDDSFAVARFEESGGRFVRGWGRFTGPHTVSVGEDSFTARKGIVVATGSKRAVPPIPGLADVDFWTTHDVIQADPLPEALIVLGGGAVGCELGQALSRFGVGVTIVEGQDRLLPMEEPEASEVVASVFEAEGITVNTGAKVERVARNGEVIEVTLEGGARLAAEKLLVATGRIVDLSDLGLEHAGLDVSTRYLEVDDRLRATDGIWAMGDVTGKAMFTHVALYQGAIIAAHILGEDPPVADYESLPRVTFTDPEVGSVGLTEAAARQKGLDVAVSVKYVAATFRGWLHGPGNDGVIKLIVDREEDVLIGATAVGPHGGEVLGFLSVAVHEKVPLANLRHMVYAFPTFHGAIGSSIGAFGRGTGRVLDPEFEPLADPLSIDG